ncbi:hypothetical protein ASG42_11635 [Rhizobium sp. Leaf391]|uniref:PGN_0703 family putative restriction endonuclease n=1 Tax=Rhizobium sp. Leaf391 TaxID=1736360 RepID=UPI0007150422|nr:hypothetical protein [Rhizobium sp. Leaf391]KQS91129.1 hypothetical protein ASG42_11635 [Rhizobium sp. Leaf391]
MTSTALTLIPTAATASAIDLSGLGSIPALPFVPETILRRHRAFVPTDNRFRAAARLLQALWREDRDLPIGVHPGRHGKGRRLGSSIAMSAGATGANFIHPSIARLAKRELIYREAGAAYDDIRLLTNLLSSQPLVFNLFGPLKLDLATATAVFDALVPGFMSEITEILFEHSPGRGELRFSGDGTAFDLLVRGYGPAGQRRFIAIEVKYSESGHEPLPRFSGRYDEIAPRSGLFIDAANPALRANPVQQLFRQMCLAHTMIETGLYDEGLHLFIAPAHNTPGQNVAAGFIRHLKTPESGRLPFMSVTLERFVEIIAEAGSTAHARALHRRYCDWWLIDGELQMEELSGCDDRGFVNQAAAIGRKDEETPSQGDGASERGQAA